MKPLTEFYDEEGSIFLTIVKENNNYIVVPHGEYAKKYERKEFSDLELAENYADDIFFQED
jgi:hypothetical protein